MLSRNPIGSYEFGAQYERICESSWPFLLYVGKLQSNVGAISEQALEQMLIFRSCDDQNLAYAREHKD